MSSTVNAAIVGHSTTGLNAIEEAIQDDPEIDISRKLLRDWALDPFEDLPVTCSVFILDLGKNWREVLDAVANRVRRNRTPIILVGPTDNSELMKLALRAGARDFQTHPLNPTELIASVHRLANEQYLSSSDSSSASMAVFMSAKGGAGSSAIVTALGHALKQRERDKRVLLVDLDLQHGNLPLYFDESSTTRLTQALIANERMDATLLDACVIPGPNGIDLLASFSDQVFSPWEISQNTVTNLLNYINDQYEYVLVDVPRQIDPITFHAMEKARYICVVMQQSLSDLRYARQILHLLRDQGLPNERLRIVANRLDKKRSVRMNDILDAFDPIECTSIPNDYKRMSFATGNAVPLVKKFQKAPISKSVFELANLLFPLKDEPRRGLFGKRRV